MGTAYGEEGKVVPQDVTRVDSLSALLKVAVSGDGESQDALVSTLTNEVLTRAQKVGERSQIESVLANHAEAFQKAVESTIRLRVEGMLALESAAEKTGASHRLLREITSAITTEHVVGQWLGFFESDVLPSEGYFSVLQESAGAEGAFHFPLGAAALEGLAPNLSLQLQARTSEQSVYVLDEDASVLVADVGGPGSHNGVVDPGEWALLRLRLINEGPAASFSASASVRSLNPCAWVDEHNEDPLAEFPADGGLVDVEFWVYVSGECSSEQPMDLELRIRESRGTVTHTLGFSVDPMPSRTVELTELLIDRDDVGYSRASVDAALTESDRLEVSAGVKASDGTAQSAWLEYSFAGDTLPLFSHIEHLDGVLSSGEPGVFHPSDDLDLELNGAPGVATALFGAGVSSRWITMDGGTVWLAVDAAVDIPLLPPQFQEADEMEVEEEEAFVMLPPPDVEDIIGIVWSSIRLQARTTTPGESGNAQAVDGVEVVLDEERLTQLYMDLTVAEDMDVQREIVEPTQAPIRYRYRFYVPLQLAVAGSVKDYYGEMARAEELAAQVEELEQDEPYEEEEGLKVRVDIGAGLSLLKYQDFEEPYFFHKEEEAIAQIQARVSVGTDVMGIAAVEFGFGAPLLEGGLDGGYVDYVGALGLGYRVRMDEALELEPHILGRISYREVTGHDQTLRRIGLGFEAGLSLRYWLEEMTGVYVSADYVVDAPGPRPVAPFEETPLVAREVFKVVGGISLGF